MIKHSQTKPTGDTPWLSGGGELGKLVRSMDWSNTPLGSPDAWPQSLKSAVSILLPSKAQIVLFWGPELVAIYNDAYAPAIGAKHPAALGRPACENWSELWDILEPLLMNVVKTGQAFRGEDYPFFIERHGYFEEVFFDVSYDPIRGEDGDVAGVFCIVSETTGRVLGERRLQTLREVGSKTLSAKSVHLLAEDVFETLAQNRSDIPFSLLYLTDEGGSEAHLAASAGLGNRGSDAAEVIDLLDKQPGSSVWPLVAADISGYEEVHDLESKLGIIPKSAWQESPHYAITLPLRLSSQKKPLGFLIIGISPRRQLDKPYREFLEMIASQIAMGISNLRVFEKERERSLKLLELDTIKTQFFANVSHEFRTPLTLMLGPLEDELATKDLPSDRQAQLELIHRSALRLQRLVNTLLDFSRIESGRMMAAFRPTNISALTADLASNFRSATDRAGLEFVTSFPLIKEKVFVDHEMWEKIVLNLLSNALKFTFAGSIKISITKKGKRIVLEVSDSGVGISANELPHLFERFYRVEGGEARVHEGSGIGLALVHELVAMHGGTIDASSAPGKGTTFNVQLPIGSAHLPQEQLQPATRGQKETTFAKALLAEAIEWSVPGKYDDIPELPLPDSLKEQKVDILVVDDNPDMRYYIQKILGQNKNWNIRSSSNGQLALEAIRRHRPSLVLSDVMMPKMDGIELVKQLRADPLLQDLPVIFLSARAGQESRIEGLEVGVDDYLVKPFSSQELIARVRTHLNLALARRAEATELKKLSDAKDEFISIASHQLRNPATAVKQNLGLLSQGFLGELQADQLLAVKRAYESNELQLEIIDILLNVAKIDAGKVTPQKVRTNLAWVLKEVTDVQSRLLKHDQTISLDIPKKPVNVMVDPSLIRMAIENLVNNAIKYSLNGEKISVSLKREKGSAVIAVTDSGIGIKKADLPKLFQKFSRLSNAHQTRVDGSGLGLYWVKKVVDLHGGSVDVTSKLHSGSTFTIKLP